MWAAGDHSKALLLSDSLLDYLERYVERVESDFYSTLKGRIEGFPQSPYVRDSRASASSW